MSKKVVLTYEKEFLQHEGLAETPACWEDGLRTKTGRGYFEWWYFDAHLDDGSTCVIVFATKPLIQHHGPLDPVVELTITSVDGIKRSHFIKITPDKFSAWAAGCDVRAGAFFCGGRSADLYGRGRLWGSMRPPDFLRDSSCLASRGWKDLL